MSFYMIGPEFEEMINEDFGLTKNNVKEKKNMDITEIRELTKQNEGKFLNRIISDIVDEIRKCAIRGLNFCLYNISDIYVYENKNTIIDILSKSGYTVAEVLPEYIKISW